MLFIQEFIKDYPSYLELPVQWGDMDAMQHVNNVSYLRYMESGRIRFFNDFLQLAALPEGIGPILAEINCRYKFPVTYPDTVVVASRIKPGSVDEFSIQLQQLVISTRHERIAAEGLARVVFYNYEKQKKAPIPEAIKARLLKG